MSVPPLYVVETEHGYATLPGKTGIAGLKLVWRLTAMDPKLGAIVHLPLLFDFEFAVECGIVSQAKADELKALGDARVAAAETTPTTEGK